MWYLIVSIHYLSPLLTFILHIFHFVGVIIMRRFKYVFQIDGSAKEREENVTSTHSKQQRLKSLDTFRGYSSHMRIQRGGGGGQGDRNTPPPSWKIAKTIGFLSNTGLDPLKNHSYQSSIQCWAITGPPAKRHLNGVSLSGR